ncbi:MAG: glycoside hydrolase family 6 protein [Deltaproteobacteria bacterium]
MRDLRRRLALGRLVPSACVVLALGACTDPPQNTAEDEDETMVVMSSGAAPAGSGLSLPALVLPPPAAPPAAVPTVMQAPPLPMNFVLEDFADGDGRLSSAGFNGRWHTYSDGTGQVTPALDADIVPVDGAVHVIGSSFSTWGVGLSVDLNNPLAQLNTRQGVDLGKYRGLSLRAHGTGTIVVELVTPTTLGTAEGGSCSGDGCFGHYAAELALGAEYAEEELAFTSFAQPSWGQPVPLDLAKVLSINFLSRVSGGPVSIDLWLEAVSLLAPLPPPSATDGTVVGGGLAAGSVSADSPFAGRNLDSDGGAAVGAYNSAQGAERDLLAKVALYPTAYWLVGGDPGQAGNIARGAGADYPVLVAYNIPNRDCMGQSAGGAGSPEAYQGWIDGMATSLMGQQAAVILEPDALALSCGAPTESLIAYAVTSLRRNPGTAVYIDGGHSNWVSADQMATRLRNAGIAQATGFAINVSNFQPTPALINYGHSLSAQVGGKPFVIDTSRNGKGAPGGSFCNPAGAGLGVPPTAGTSDPLVHAFLWVKRPGESDGSCGECSTTPAGQFCRSYALELARNAAF